MAQRNDNAPSSPADPAHRSAASGSQRPEKPDPLAPPRTAGPKIDRDPLAKGSVRPNPSGDLDE